MRAGNRRFGALCLGAVTTTVVALSAAGTAQAAPAPQGNIQGADRAGAIAGQYIVAFDGQPSVAASARADVRSRADELVRGHGGQVRQVYAAAFRGFALKATEQQAREIAAAPGIRYVQADQVFKAVGSQPNPPSWGIDRIDGQKDSTYNYPNTGEGVTAYIVDTGLHTQHSNFEGRASSGHDFIDNDNDSSDCHGHGTHVAGTVGSKDYGVAKAVKLVGVRVLNCQGSGSTSQIVAGMDWVTKNAAKPAVANMSLGGDSDQAMDDAVKGTIDSGVQVAVAAGNDSKDACSTSPARLPAAITLGSTDSSDARSSFSNYGSCLDLFAPGSSIVSTKNGGGTATMSGTSMATPHTAGAAALYLSGHKDATPQQVRDALVNNAQSGVVTGPGSGSPNKFLDVSKLGGPTNPGEPTADFTAQCSSTNTDCAFDGSASKDPDGSIASYAWDFGDGASGKGDKPAHSYAKAGTYSVKLTVTDNDGKTGTVTKQVTAGAVEPPTGEAPDASFTVSCWYASCDFDASASSDPDNDIAGYGWKFGDGQTATGATAKHAYPAGQRTYTAELTVSDKAGHTDTASKQITCYDFGAGNAFCFAG